MPQPEGAGILNGFSPRLTNMALGYLPSMTQFVGSKVFPSCPVGAQTGSYNILPRDEFIRAQGKKLANGEPAPLGGFKFTTGTYSVSEYGLATQITNRDLANAAVAKLGAGRLRNMKTQFVTFQALLAMEVDIATLVTTGGNWTNAYSGVTSSPSSSQFIQWDQSTSDPISDVKKKKEVMRLATGFEPNKMLMTQPIVNALSVHAEVVDRIKYTGSSGSPAKVNLQTLAELFEIDEIVVPKSVQNTAHENATTAISDIWGKNVFLWYTPGEGPSMELPSAGYRFSWAGNGDSEGVGPQPFGMGLNPEGLLIRNYMDLRAGTEFVESRWYTVPLVTGAGLGILMSSAVA